MQEDTDDLDGSGKHMATYLLVIIFIAFISLGLPDSMFGAAWPAIYTELDLDVSLAGVVTFVISICTILSSLISTRVIKKWGTGIVTAISAIMTALAMYGFSMSKGLVWFLVCAIPLGLGAGCIDAALNNYVALHYKATHMNFLHCFYGVGVTISPYIMSIALEKAKWKSGYIVVSLIQLAIAILLFISLPVWKKVETNNTEKEEDEIKVVPYKEMIKHPKALPTWIMFFAYCGIECTGGIWGSTYLVLCKSATVEVAARCVMFYYGGLALGRFFSGVFANKISAWKLIYIGYTILGMAIVVMLLPINFTIASVMFFLIGFGCAPIYPNLMHLTPINFSREMSQSMMGAQSAAAFTGSTFLPPLFGIIAQYISPEWFAGYIFILYVIMLGALIKLIKRKRGKEDERI